ncbi:uncharacterized protein LOC135847269 isoform X3 [Planococcus citri]|uniref:uncharacterized protein LOC135847269 isoform X3 n=1 Tax=Planococcus citri TaxID=170843 RepID=UPI0031F9D963
MPTKQNLAAVRKMAAKKGSQVQFQIDVTTDEEWNKLMERQGLVVIDIYSEWCGPCTAMVSSLKKLKLEIGSDYLHFALAKSNTIDALKRFRDKSEPMWMFIAIPFEELTEAEKERQAVALAKEQQMQLIYQEKLAAKMNAIRERSLMKLAKLIPTHSCVIYFPQMVSSDGSCSVAQKMMYLNDSISAAVVDQMQVQFNADTIKQVFYKCPIFPTLPASLQEAMQSKPVLVTLIQSVITDDAASNTLSPRNCRTDEYQTIEQKLTKIVYGDENPTGYSDQSVAFEFIVENDKGEKIPPMWTPISVLSKAAAIEVLFPRKVESIGYAPDSLPPPQLIIIYDAAKACDIIELTKDFTQDIYKIGFFDSIDPTNAKVICKSYKQFCDLSEEKKKNAKMVVAIKKGDNDDLLLEFAQVIPLYISPNEKVGSEESEQFFPFDYDDLDDEVEEKQVDSFDEDKENINIDNYEIPAE